MFMHAFKQSFNDLSSCADCLPLAIQPTIETMKNHGSDAKEVGARLERYIRASGMNYVQFADAVATLDGPDSKIGPQTVTHWRKTGKISRERLPMICRVLGITPNELLGIEGASKQMPGASTALDNNAAPSEVPQYQVPVISWVRAGAFAAALDVRSMEDVSQWVRMDTKPGPRSFALQVKGKSMEDEFAEGDWIVIDPDADWQSGDYVIIGNGGEEATFKQIVREGTDWFLVPVNRQFAAQKLSADCRVIGKMVWKQPKGRAY